MSLKLLIIASLLCNLSGYVKSESDYDTVIVLLNDDKLDEPASYESSVQPVFSDGVWMCGNCSDLHDTNVIYNESYDVNANDVDNLTVQVAISVQNMRCVTVTTENIIKVELVSGVCTGDSVTLNVAGTSHYDVTVY